MSQTVVQTITNALQRIGVVDESRAPSAQQTQNCMNYMNSYLATQMRDGWRGLGFYPQTSAASTMPIRDSDIYDVETVLCMQFAINYQVQLDPEKQGLLLIEIESAINRLNKRYLAYFESDLSELSRAQSAPWGAPGWV